MTNQDTVEKNYYQQIQPGDYVDYKNRENQWKMVRIVDKDRLHATIVVDGHNFVEEHVYLNSFKIAPLRAYTEGYTGSIYRPYRAKTLPHSELKTHLEVMNNKFLGQKTPSAFQITQYLRGQLFVIVHNMLCSQRDLKEEDVINIKTFLYGFIDFVVKLCRKVKGCVEEYFEVQLNNNKYLYLVNEKIAFVHCLTDLLILLNMILKVQVPKYPTIFKNFKPQLTHDTFLTYFGDLKGLNSVSQLFGLTDGNGRWLPFTTRKQVYRLMQKYNDKAVLPVYKVKDFLQIFQIYPFMIEIGESIKHQQEYILFIVSFLKEQSPFEAKLKSIQELRRIVDEELKMKSFDSKMIYDMICSKEIIQSLLNQYNFNPEIFKRFVPILVGYSKTNYLPPKTITSLFRLAQIRHESQLSVIYEIICGIAELAQTDTLDCMFADICKLQINNEQVLKFIKRFTINAIVNYSKQKSFLMSFFRRNKNSSKYGYFGLPHIYKQVLDTGRITKAFIPQAMEVLKEIFNNELFHGERHTYLSYCLTSIEKKKSFGQSIKLIIEILNTFPVTSYLNESRKQVVEKIDGRGNIVQPMIDCIKEREGLSFEKVTFIESMKYFFEFLENFGEYLNQPIKVEHLQYLWTQQYAIGKESSCTTEMIKMLCDFLRKTKSDQIGLVSRRKYFKRISKQLIKNILLKIPTKMSFYQRNLIYEQFEALQELFLSYHWDAGNIEISERGYSRYKVSNLQGSMFFFEFVRKMAQTPFFQRILKRTIEIFLRPIDQSKIQQRVGIWKNCLLRIVQQLKQYPSQCLRAIKIFFEMIEGRLHKQVSSKEYQNSREVVVSSESIEKSLIVSNNSTIFKLRKLVMEAYGLQGDFIMYNTEMRRDITFVQQEDFNISAMPLKEKGASLIVVSRKRDKHPHFIALERFKQTIEKEQSFYNTIFSLIGNQQTKELFWKTVEMLPVNHAMVRKIEKCDNYTLDKWRQFLSHDSDQGLEYCLNIIYDLMENNVEWTHNFLLTDGLTVIEGYIAEKVSHKESQSIAIKLIMIITRMLDVLNKNLIEPQRAQMQNELLVKAINVKFGNREEINQVKQVKIVYPSLQLLNCIIGLIKKNCKLFKQLQSIQIKLQSIIQMMEYGLFQPKDKHTVHFTENSLIEYILTYFKQIDIKSILLTRLFSFLQLSYLRSKQSCELYFSFLIDFLNSFLKEELDILFQQSKLIGQITAFLHDTINSKEQDKSKSSSNPILFGFFKLLQFSLSSDIYKEDIIKLFDLILQQFLFKKNVRRIKSEKNSKLLFEAIKRMLFRSQDALILPFIDAISPQLRSNQWRTNSLMAWSLQPQKQQKNLFCGLQNLGATCYINCLFQQLFMIKDFRDHFINIDSTTYKATLEENEIYQLQNIFGGLKYSNKKSLSTRKFCESFITYQGTPINPSVQSDADQFFNTLMEKVEAFLRLKGRHDVIERTFEGKLANVLNCEGCPHSSEKVESFLSIGLNIRNKNSLEQALQAYVQGEILDGDNAYFCQICSKKVRTMKRLCIKELPKVLVIVLKRFEFNYDEMRKIKMNNYLSYPQQLNMRKYTIEHAVNVERQEAKNEKVEKKNSKDGKTSNSTSKEKSADQNSNQQKTDSDLPVKDKEAKKKKAKKQKRQSTSSEQKKASIYDYRLRGVVVHSGTSEGGHYYSFIKEVDKWYQFNDEYIEESTFKRIQEQGFGGQDKDSDGQFKFERYRNAYVLFYEKKADIQVPKDLEVVESNSEEATDTESKVQVYKTEDFQKQIRHTIEIENLNADFLSVILDSAFIHLCENLVALDSLETKKFIMLYFHTMVLRSKQKEEYFLNYFRIIAGLLKCDQINEWYLVEADREYLKEFCIEAPKMVRYICTSFLMMAIQNCKQLPEKFVRQGVTLINKKGMTPYTKIFMKLAEKDKNLLLSLQYPQRVLNLLLDTNHEVAELEKEDAGEGYFGHDASIKEKQRDFCAAAMTESLKLFQIRIEDALKIFELYNNREGSKTMASIIARNTKSQQVHERVTAFAKRLIKGDFKLQEVEKYMFLLREFSQILDESQDIRIEVIVVNLHNILATAQNYYDPIDTIVREIVKMAARCKRFEQRWRNYVEKNNDLHKLLKFWLRESEKPYLMTRTQQWKRKTSGMNFSEKTIYQEQMKAVNSRRIAWMLQDSAACNDIHSDVEDQDYKGAIIIRSKKFVIKEHFGLLKKVEIEKMERWGIMEKGQFDLHISL